MRYRIIAAALAVVTLLSVAGCTETQTKTVIEDATEVAGSEGIYIDAVEMLTGGLENEANIISSALEAAIPDVMEPVASGVLVEDNGKATIDYSNTKDGYIMARYYGNSSARLKAQVVGPKTTYTYNLTKGEWSVLPLTDGEGKYQFKIFQNVSGTQYALVLAASATVTLEDEFAPFLRPNKYVDYSISSETVKMARELTKGIDNPLGKVEAIYNYVVKNMSYDKQKAATVKSGYVPVLDDVLAEQKGICFDYAALMTGMLRSQGIPCKMVFGYAGSAYHAWISIWTEDTGWVDGAIFFDGTTWQRMDPTFASSANQSDYIMKYIGDGKNYKEKYLY
ncbi:MAG: transglutaminase domain-containing protein [Oscillospiraceae bacterium]|nr:transglutaminase domain-containing protein [Oscillospiraceae bacterium]